MASNPTLYFFRHGQTEWNAIRRRQGQLNSPLTEKGQTQALENAKRLQQHCSLSEDIKVYASPLGRARQTALIILGQLGLSEDCIQFDDRLMECDYGDWSGLTVPEIKEKFPEQWAARQLDRWNVPALNGESYADIHARKKEWLSSVPLAETTLVIGHGQAGRVLRGVYRGLTPHEVFALEEPQEGFYALQDGQERLIR